MKSKLSESLVTQLTSALDIYEDLRRRSQYDDLSGLPASDHHKFIAMARAAIDRIAGRQSTYAQQAQEIVDRRNTHDGHRAIMLAGVLESLRSDLKAGYLATVVELVHGEVFGDFLEMAEHLLAGGYKDPAAVIAGGTLEAHLRQLCAKVGIDIQEASPTSPRAKKADVLNADLARATAYSKLDQKNVTAWLDLRNKAAHGKYAEYSKEQVVLLVAGIRDFISRVPA